MEDGKAVHVRELKGPRSAREALHAADLVSDPCGKGLDEAGLLHGVGIHSGMTLWRSGDTFGLHPVGQMPREPAGLGLHKPGATPSRPRYSQRSGGRGQATQAGLRRR